MDMRFKKALFLLPICLKPGRNQSKASVKKWTLLKQEIYLPFRGSKANGKQWTLLSMSYMSKVHIKLEVLEPPHDWRFLLDKRRTNLTALRFSTALQM